jgi:hypothetical protein
VAPVLKYQSCWGVVEVGASGTRLPGSADPSHYCRGWQQEGEGPLEDRELECPTNQAA